VWLGRTPNSLVASGCVTGKNYMKSENLNKKNMQKGSIFSTAGMCPQPDESTQQAIPASCVTNPAVDSWGE